MTEKDKNNYKFNEIQKRRLEISKVKKLLNFKKVLSLGYPPASLENQKRSLMISKIKLILDNLKPEEIFIPHYSDIQRSQSDFEITASCTKNFRARYIKRILCYQTISETNLT